MQRRIMMLSLCGLLACGEPPTSPDSDPDDSTLLPTLSLSPSQGPPGSIIAIDGFDLSALAGEISVTIAGRPTSVLVGDDGQVLAALPLFTEPDGSISDPPADPVDVTLFSDGTVVAEAVAAFEVTPRPVAPGAIEDMSAALQSIVKNSRTLALSLEPQPGVGQAYATVTMDAVEALLTGNHEYSLDHQLELLDTSDSESKALLEGWLVASGVLEQLETVAELTARVNAALQATALQSGMSLTTEIGDSDLATRMQLYVMLRDFGAQVLGETATTWAQTVGLAAGVAGLAITVPYISQVTAALGVASFAINNVALAYLPAKVDLFELALGQPFVFPGGVAETEVWIQASNSPPPITVLNLVDLVLTGMGLANSANRETLRGIITSVADFYLAQVRSLMTAYGQANPNVDIALDVASIPSMTWRAKVTDVRYVTPKSFTPELIDANGSGILAWRAGIAASGEGRIYASINTGADVLEIPLIPAYEYNAGAFGDDILNTETHSVEIGAPLVVTATMDNAISAGGVNGLEVRAGTLTALGDTLWQAGLAVSTSATGGTVDPAQGVTGADGRFDTFVTLGSSSDSVVVDVTVTATNGFQAETSVSANRSGDLVLAVEFVERLIPTDSALLAVTASRRGTGGQLVAAPGVSIRADVRDGRLTDEEGLTNENGSFQTYAFMDESENEIIIALEAQAVDGSTASDTVSARRPNEIWLGDRDGSVAVQVFAGYRPDSTSAYLSSYRDDMNRRNDDALGPLGVFQDSVRVSGDDGWARGSATVTHSSEVELQATEFTVTFVASVDLSTTVVDAPPGVEWISQAYATSILNLDLAVWGDSVQYTLEVDVEPGLNLTFGSLGICYEDGEWCYGPESEPSPPIAFSGALLGRHRLIAHVSLSEAIGTRLAQEVGTQSSRGTVSVTLRIQRPDPGS